jgi:hypothetical protein
MALDDYLEPEVAVAVAVTAAVASPPVRKVLRQGAVYGLAGLMMAGDKLTAIARSAAEGARQAAGAAGREAHGAVNPEAPAPEAMAG